MQGEHFDSEPEEGDERKEDEGVERTQNFFFLLTKHMQERGLTLQKMLHGRIFDDVFNRQHT